MGTKVEDTRGDLEVAQRAVEALRQGLGDALLAVVLFGSRARGEARENSDWDLLVLSDGLARDTFTRHLALKRLLPPDDRSALSLMAKTPDEFEAHLPALYLDVALDGKVLYDPKGYAERRLAQLRNLIEQGGLRRRRTPDGDVWEWDAPPLHPCRLEWSA